MGKQCAFTELRKYDTGTEEKRANGVLAKNFENILSPFFGRQFQNIRLGTAYWRARIIATLFVGFPPTRGRRI